MFQAFISLQSPEVHFFTFDMGCVFKNHGSFFPFFQIVPLKVLLVENQEKLVSCCQLGLLGKVDF